MACLFLTSCYCVFMRVLLLLLLILALILTQSHYIMYTIRTLACVFASVFSLQIGFSQTATTTTISKTWHHDNRNVGQMWGVSTADAYNWLKQEGKHLKPIVVAVIDGDLDINHEDLKDKLWQNPKPTGRYYVGAQHGWNFLGTKDGQMVTKTGTESFREYKRLRSKYEGKKREDFSNAKDLKELEYFLAVKADSKIQGYLNFFPYIKLTYEAYHLTDSLLALSHVNHNTIPLKEVSNLKNADTTVQQYIDAAVRSSYKFADTTSWSTIFDYQKNEYQTAIKRIQSLNNTSNPRDSIGDAVDNIKDKYYGNGQLVDSNSYHGTFVAGLIGASRNNGIGIDGIADNVLLMGIRAVPDGDEFDKDIALAIRFAVDHGANIINMSFGKYFSPHSEWVTEAIAYAIKKNVLVVQAAGNDAKDLNSVQNYPKAPEVNNRKQGAYLLVGASTVDGKRAKFSNFGSAKVHVFAPGDKVTSTMTGNAYNTASGTSFSAPIVSGVGAVVWGAYPRLKAYEVAEIIKSAAALNTTEGLKDQAIVPGVVNLLDALKIAKEYVEK